MARARGPALPASRRRSAVCARPPVRRALLGGAHVQEGVEGYVRWPAPLHTGALPGRTPAHWPSLRRRAALAAPRSELPRCSCALRRHSATPQSSESWLLGGFPPMGVLCEWRCDCRRPRQGLRCDRDGPMTACRCVSDVTGRSVGECRLALCFAVSLLGGHAVLCRARERHADTPTDRPTDGRTDGRTDSERQREAAAWADGI